MPETGPDRGTDAASLASALRAQAELSRDPAMAESLRHSAAKMEEADARLQEGLASLEQAIAEARALAEDRGGENTLPRWVVVALVVAVVVVLLLSMAIRGGP
jgi:anti-sigma factor RsiW